MNKIKIALLGFGTVGKGTFNLLQLNKEIISHRIQADIEISKIYVRNPDKYSDVTLPKGTTFTTDINDVLKDPEISIVIELMGGTKFARECIESALSAGKNVVTANKDLIAEAGPSLLMLANKNGVDFKYEASVLGGIPIIRALQESLGGNQITELVGIMNGTTNYILSKMTEDGLGYAEVLKEAQALGYAEADPTSDVEGYDAARKLAILASIAFNRRIFFDDVHCEGITQIDKTDIEYGKDFGYTIKLLGIAKETKKGLSLNVYPAFIPQDHPLASVRGAYNAIYVKGNGIDDAMFYGRGAGDLPTGSAVVSDIMEVAKNLNNENTGNATHFYYPEKQIYATGKIESSYYLRLCVDNKVGVLAKVANKLAEQRISVQSVIQRHDNQDMATIAIVTAACPGSYVKNVLDELNTLRSVRNVESVLRIMND